MAEASPEPQEQTPASICAICQSPVQPGEQQVACGSCGAPYHSDCWEENGGCGVYGCPEVPETDSRTSIEIPTSYWGKERKMCPACGADILAAAVRCRLCGASFESSRPERPQEYRSRRDVNERLPKTRKAAIWLFVCSVIPLLAPFAAVYGPIWYGTRRADLKALPAIYLGLTRIAIAVAIGQTVFMILIALFRTAAGAGHAQ